MYKHCNIFLSRWSVGGRVRISLVVRDNLTKYSAAEILLGAQKYFSGLNISLKLLIHHAFAHRRYINTCIARTVAGEIATDISRPYHSNQQFVFRKIWTSKTTNGKYNSPGSSARSIPRLILRSQIDVDSKIWENPIKTDWTTNNNPPLQSNSRGGAWRSFLFKIL